MKQQKRLWAYYAKIGTIKGQYIALFCIFPFISIGLSCLAYSSDINAGVQNAVKIALLNGIKWYAIIMPIITVLYLVWFFLYSGTVEFSDDAIHYYRYLFSKTFKRIPYEIIDKCVLSDGLWKRKYEDVCGRKILFYYKQHVVLSMELNPQLCLSAVLNLNDKEVRIVGESRKLRTLDNYFKIDFMGLSYEQQLILLKYYCKLSRNKYKTGEEILRKKKKQNV